MTSTTETDQSSVAVARFLGALNTVVALVVTLILARALTDLAQEHVGTGLELLVVVVVVRVVAAGALREWAEHEASLIRHRWRRDLPAHLAQPRLEHERARGDLALAIEQAAEAPLLDVLSTSARVAVLGLALVWWSAGWLSLSISVALVAGAVPLYQRAGRRSESMAAQYGRRRALLEARQLEVLRHGPELRALGAVSFGAMEIGAISDSEHAIALSAIRVALQSSLVTEFLSGVSIGLVAMVVGFALLGGRISLEHALIGVLTTSEVFVQVRRFGVEFHRRDDAIRARALLRGVITTATLPSPHEVLNCTNVVTSVQVRAVTLDLHPGTRVLVSGPSGSGKTTLLETLLGWRAPVSGTVALTDGPVGYVSVDSALVSGSLRENLALGAAVSERRIRDVLDALGLDGARFEDLDAVLLADGAGTSTGERVRLVLARALLCEPALVILDDVGGVLDAIARQRVREVLSSSSTLAVIEASVDHPILEHFDARVRLEP